MTKSKHTCRYCDRAMRVSAASYAENPFCSACLQDRMQAAAARRPPGQWVLQPNGYAHWVVDEGPEALE